VCAGTILEFKLNNVNTFTNSGYTFQWYSGTTTIVGPFTAANGATTTSYVTPPLTLSSFYNIVVTCSLSPGSSTSVVQHVTVSPVTSSVVPYFESFETLAYNKLPNCSWSASDPNGATKTGTVLNTNNRIPHSGSNYATFGASPTATNYFYSNGIFLQPGITYSASLWYITETVNYNKWQSISISLATGQTSTGLVPIANASQLSAVVYTPLSNTFVVSSPGTYYIAVGAVAGSGVAPYLTWDDLAIIVPCSLNSPPLVVSANTNTICAGQTINLNANGADTYSWNTGATTSTITDTPTQPTTYTVYGTHTLSGCSSTVTEFIQVNPSPQIVISSNFSVICTGNSAVLTAQGLGQYAYQWSHGPIVSQISVSPLSNTTYSVMAVNNFGCTKMGTNSITVKSTPTLVTSASSENICEGEPVTLSATGASSYQWTADLSTIYVGSPITISPVASGIYTVTGTDANGCQSTAQVIVGVNECTGIPVNTLDAGISLYPVPFSDRLFVSHIPSGTASTITLYDMSGRIVSEQCCTGTDAEINASALAAGMYYVVIRSAGNLNRIKVVKQ
jgi:hypothetical protein